jgi:protein required for attachment to host cells
MTTWILVGDASRIRIFATAIRDDAWSLVKEFEHLEGRQLSSELQPSSPPGRVQQGKAAGARHTALEPATSPKEAEAERFAHQLSEFLEEATASRSFDHLVLVAPPHFLGVLHAKLGRQTARLLQATLNKDLVRLQPAELRERLLDQVYPRQPTAN